MITDDERVAFAKDFYRRAYDQSLGMKDPVIDFSHRAMEGISEGITELRFQVFHTLGTTDGVEAALLHLAAQLGRNHRIIAKRLLSKQSAPPADPHD